MEKVKKLKDGGCLLGPTVGTNVERRVVFVKVRVVKMDIAVGMVDKTVQLKPKKLVLTCPTSVSKNKQVIYLK